MKKQLLILIALFTVLIGYSQTVGDTFVDNFITYEVTSISPYEVEANDYDHNNGSSDVDIPASVTNGGTTFNVTSIGGAAFENNGPSNFDVTGVIIPSSITSIGAEAFKSQKITSVIIPGSVVSIGNQAFIGNDLTDVTFENGLESIGENSFQNNQITSIIIPNSVISIGQFAFQDNQLASATLSNNLASIEFAAFQINQLQSVVIPNSVTSIGNSAFYGNQLTSVTLSNSLLTIGNGAFQNNSITHVTVPSSVTDIDFAAFRNNPLATVTSQGTTPANIFMPGINDSFWNRAVIDLTIPTGTSAAYASGGWTGFNSVTEVSPLAVGDTFVVDFITYEVTSTTANTVEAIDYDMAGGTVVDIPASVSYSVVAYDVTRIGTDAFLQKGLTNLSIPESVTYIGSSAFRNNQLISISIPNSVTTMLGRAFENNILESVVIGNGVPNIGSLTFYDNQIDNLIIGSGVLSISSNAFNANNLTSLTIPDSVTSIASNAFLDNELTNISFGNGLTDIGSSAFRLNQLVSITIPDNVTQIATSAFRNNPLTSVIALGTTPPIINTAASGDSFSNDRSNINLILTNNTTDEYVTDSGALWTGFKMVFEATSPTTVEVSNYDPANGTNAVIPATVTAGSIVFDVTKIDDSAFENVGLTSVTIPDSVTEIGISAFNTNNLTSVTIPDSVTLIETTAFATNSITNLSLGANVTDIGIGAFVDNDLTDVTIPSNVTFIGLLAFGNNPLTSVTSFATTPPTITTGTNDTFAFNRSNIELHIPPGTLAAYVTNPGALWTGFNPVTQDASLSTSNFELEHDIKIVTNSDVLKIISSGSVKLKSYSIYSISGAKVNNGTESTIAIDKLSGGIYILELTFDTGKLVKKFAK